MDPGLGSRYLGLPSLGSQTSSPHEEVSRVRMDGIYRGRLTLRWLSKKRSETEGYQFEDLIGSISNKWNGLSNNETNGDYASSFEKIRLYAEVAKEKNPGSVVDGRSKGYLLAAIGKDDDNDIEAIFVKIPLSIGLFSVAYGVVDSETDDNWLWFLLKLRSIMSARELTFITDRHTSLHLKGSLRDMTSGRVPNGFRERVVNLFNDCALAPTVLDFENCVNELFEVGGDRAKEFVASIPLYHWANAYFRGKRYGEMTSNAIESFNNWILEA
ncbi:uncharacterized protein LOC131317389 [Rhododendron vialii]|uniref:uncharacterized protein LOC131317389 n=1 Tax=Rhododendron vialii TaxID=182163 RepID=UPI00265E22BE|nr:uncharacterized protein LOC131317389 [Rhododendron vialii]